MERWEYIGDLILRNGALFQVAVPDGRAVFANGTWNYELHYTDHLGNVRASINRQGQLISSSHFDPWGHRLQGLGTTATQLSNRWELQGKERDLTFGLNRINFGARVYNPTIGVWDQVDPLGEKYTNLSPYQYVANNPLRFIDPDGRETWDVWGATTFSGYAGDDGSGRIVGRTPGKEGNEDPGKGQKKPEGKTEKKRWDHGLVPVYSSYLDGKEAESRGDYASMVGHSFVAALEFVSMALTYGESGIMISGVRQGVVKGTAKGGLSNARALGIAGEEAVGVGAKTRIPSLTGTAKYRIPDQLTSTTLGEVKNVGHQSLTRQLMDFHLYSQQTGRQFILYTRPNTTFSGPLQNLINNRSIITKPIPFR